MRTVSLVIAGAALAVLSSVGTPAVAQSGGGASEGNAVKIAYVYPDVSAVADTGFVLDPGDPEAQVKAFVDALNQRGGVNGRQVELSVHSYDVLAADLLAAQRAACLAATEDDEAMVVLSPSMFDDPILCVTRQHKTPLVVQNGTSTELVRRSGGRLFTTNFTWRDALRSGAQAFGKSLKDRTVGIIHLDEAGLEADVEQGLVKPLAAQGVEVAERIVLPGIGNSETTAAIPTAIERLRTAGVDALLIATNTYVSSLFLTQAQQAGYEPTYYATDLAEASTNILPRLGPKGVMAGAQGVSWRTTGDAEEGESPGAFDEQCVQTYVRQSGEQAPTFGEDEYDAVVSTCALVNLFELAATEAGSDLTPASFARSMSRVRDFELGGGAKGSYGPKRYDAPDTIRKLEIKESCSAPGAAGKSCWLPAGKFVPFER